MGTKIKIYELFLRDGLQSLEKCYTAEERIEMFKELNQCGLSGIEFGSTTKATIVPQMKDSFVLWDYVKEHQQPDTKYTMLIQINITLNLIKYILWILLLLELDSMIMKL